MLCRPCIVLDRSKLLVRNCHAALCAPTANTQPQLGLPKIDGVYRWVYDRCLIGLIKQWHSMLVLVYTSIVLASTTSIYYERTKLLHPRLDLVQMHRHLHLNLVIRLRLPEL